MKTNAHGILAAAILAAGTANANPIIEDTFSNGIPEDTDEVAGYWVARGNTGFSIVESDGKVTMKTVQGDNKTARWTKIVSAEPDPNMNFLKRPVTFSAELGAFSGTTVDKKSRHCGSASFREVAIPGGQTIFSGLRSCGISGFGLLKKLTE
jgi:hypothetical protein